MLNKFRWIDGDSVLAIHDAQVAEHGGSQGIRDHALLESTLARPQNAASYVDTDVAELAALYALGIIKNQPFIEGNKRVGAVLLETFLQLHGHELTADDEQLLSTIIAVDGGELTEDSFKTWVRANTRKL